MPTTHHKAPEAIVRSPVDICFGARPARSYSVYCRDEAAGRRGHTPAGQRARADSADPVRLRRRERERHRESAQRARPAVPAWRQVDRAIDHQRPRSAPSQARLTRPTSTSAGPRQSSTVGPTYGSETGRTSNIASPAWSRSTTASSTKFFSSPAGPKRAGSVTVGSNTRRSAGGPSFHWAIGKEPGSCR